MTEDQVEASERESEETTSMPTDEAEHDGQDDNGEESGSEEPASTPVDEEQLDSPEDEADGDLSEATEADQQGPSVLGSAVKGAAAGAALGAAAGAAQHFVRSRGSDGDPEGSNVDEQESESNK